MFSHLSTEEDKKANGQSKKENGTSDGVRPSDSSRLNFTDLLKIGIKSQEILPKLIMDEM